MCIFVCIVLYTRGNEQRYRCLNNYVYASMSIITEYINILLLITIVYRSLWIFSIILSVISIRVYSVLEDIHVYDNELRDFAQTK